METQNPESEKLQSVTKMIHRIRTLKNYKVLQNRYTESRI